MNTSKNFLLAVTSVALIGAAALAQERAPKLHSSGGVVATAPASNATKDHPFLVHEYGATCNPYYGHLYGRVVFGEFPPPVLEVTYGPTSLGLIPCMLAIGSKELDVPLPFGCTLLNNALILIPFHSDLSRFTTWRAPLPLTFSYEIYIQAAEEIAMGVVETSNGLRVNVL